MTARVDALHRAMRAACFEVASPADAGALLARSQVEGADRAALLSGPQRFPLYRKLVRGTLGGLCESILSRGHAHLEATAPGAWDAAFDAFLAGRGPRTPHLRDVPSELCEVLLPRLSADVRVPAYVVELFQWELATFRLGAARDVPDPDACDVDASLPLAFHEPSARLRVSHAIHEAGEHVGEPPARRDTRLFLYRDREHLAVTVVLTPFADELLVRAQEGAPLGVAIGGAAEALGVSVCEPLLTEVARWLADFGERGVVLGSRVV
ncbi:MAG TPA: hypothetical protein PK141_07020 [Polyangiaceae bacterium]|nr:hypothetical protein [Polyangiaceae bacterium]